VGYSTTERAGRWCSRALAVALAVSCITGRVRDAAAQGSTQQSASILFFPTVQVDETHDTVIQITNASNSARNARCVYLDGSLTAAGAPRCAQTNFDLQLVARQTALWVVSAGQRATSGAVVDDIPQPLRLVPPLAAGFAGALVCVEVDAAGFPIAGNAMIGTATLQHPANGNVAQYDAFGLRGFDTNDGNEVLCLGGTVTAACPNGAEYEGCPGRWVLNFIAEGAEDPLAGAGSSVQTELTVLPCAQDFRLSNPTSVTVNFSVYNEFESQLSASTDVSCWVTSPLIAISDLAFSAADLGTLHARAVVTAGLLDGGVALVAREIHSVSGAPASSGATVPHLDPADARADVITLPPVR